MWTFRNIQIGEFGDFFVEEIFRTDANEDISGRFRHIPVGADVSMEAPRVQAVAAAVWTDEVKAAYAALTIPE